MSVKRQATTELNHDNWDQDDPADHEEMGSFQIAPKDILEKRVIRTAKRRSNLTSEEPKKSVFSGFGGFNKTQPASFDFLSKLTNGSNDNNTATSKVETPMTSSLFSSKPASGPSSGLFGVQSATSTFKSPFSSPPSQGSKSLFGTSSGASTFTMPKSDSETNDSPFKLNTSGPKENDTDSEKPSTGSITFGSKTDTSSSSTSEVKSIFGNNSTPFKMQTNSIAQAQNTFSAVVTTANQNPPETKKTESSKDEKKLQYYSKLKGLNESVLDWIKTHVEQTPLCILSPIFKDYENYLKEIQEEYEGTAKKVENTDKKQTVDIVQVKEGGYEAAKGLQSATNKSPESKPSITSNTKPLFGIPNDKTTPEKPSTFSFGIGASTGTSSTITTSLPGFSFGTNTSTQQSIATSSFSAFSTNTTTSNGTAAPFSFGGGKPFSFSPNVKQNTEDAEEKEDEDTPPKVEFTPVAEENSVFDKKCKIFVKKDGNFVDKGVGTLYIKKVEDTGKHQLLVRANTNLGTILVNLILASAIPIQRMGKNNVMMVCVPIPDAKATPTPILIRVKTSEEADDLLETLNKYKT